MFKIGILVFNDVEELDFVGPFETLSYINKLNPGSATIDLIAENNSIVTAFNGLRFLPNTTLENNTKYDILIVPGGNGRHQAMYNESIKSFIKAQLDNLKYLCSVCTGSFIISESLTTNGLTATSHYTALDEMTQRYDDMIIVSEKVVKNETNPKIWYAAGVSSGINLALELVEEIFDTETSKEIAKRIEFDNIN
ncbi:MAG: DJ-1/PfpI family protein [Clostridia bacterium]